MTELNYLKAMLLGAVQGITEFLPISSSGHLALTQRWLGLDPGGTEMLLFDLLAHTGTLAAVAIVFRRQVKSYVVRLFRESSGFGSGKLYAWRIALLAAVATLPTAAIGWQFRDAFQAVFDKPVWIAAGLLITGVLLAVLVLFPRGRRGWKDFRLWEVILIGTAQALAIMPGISRSGATICAACYCGWRRRWAAEFSFLIAVPAILGVTAIKINDAFGWVPCLRLREHVLSVPSFHGHLLVRESLLAPMAMPPTVAWGPVIAGSAVSLLVGVFALKVLLGVVRRAKLHYFAIYCWALAALVLAGAG